MVILAVILASLAISHILAFDLWHLSNTRVANASSQIPMLSIETKRKQPHKGIHKVENDGNHINGTAPLNNDTDFEQIIWPKLRQKLCPKGVPDTSMGPTLFRLGRIEFGLDPNASAIDDPEKASRNRHRISEYFYDGGFGFTIFLDGTNTSNGFFYVPIWKCANDQIHSYLHRVVNRMADGKIRKSVDSSNAVDHTSDTYLERLNIKALEYTLHEVLDRKKNKTNVVAPSDEKNNDFYFTYNDSARTKPCVFAVLRDPISHFLSGYNEVEFRLISRTGGAPGPKEDHKLGSYTEIPYDQGPDQRKKRFTTLVKNLLKEHSSFPEYGLYKHFASISRVLPTLDRFDLLPDEHTSWYLPTLENLTETFPEYLAERCPLMSSNYQQYSNENNPTMAFPTMVPRGKHESSNDIYGTYQPAKDVWKEGGFVARALCALHAMDYSCFEDMPIPPVCRDVYYSERFFQAVLHETSS